jgi:membrane protein DedA with SNARE-associated domain
MTLWLTNYGSITLFVLLALGIVAFPVPEETLMVFAGILMGSGKLGIPSTIIAAFAGSLCGITTSYVIGRTAGSYFTHRYGKWLGLTEAKLERAHYWFEHYGKWSLFVGYFIPGVRHFTGLIAGTTALDLRQFILFAYTGGIFWVSTFLSIGYFFGEYALTMYASFEKFELNADWVVVGLLVIIVMCGAYAAFRHFRSGQEKD